MAEEKRDLLPLLVLGGLILLGARRAEARKEVRKPEEKPKIEEKPEEKPPEEERPREPMLRILPIEVMPKVREEPKKMERKIEIETPLGKLEIRETPLGKFIQPPIGLPIVLPGQHIGKFIKEVEKTVRRVFEHVQPVVHPIATVLAPAVERLKDVLKVVRL